jgi:2,2-dialkylglycine decarboxylase (pyruvate)
MLATSADPRRNHVFRYTKAFDPGEIAEASGAWLVTKDGRRIMDFTSGQFCAILGHSHPAIAKALTDSASTLSHLNSWMLSEPVLELSSRLAELSADSLNRVLLVSTGGEANEAALKMAKMATGRYEVVGLTRAWHGLQAGALSVNTMGARHGYGPLVPGALAIPAPYSYRCPIRHCTDVCDCTCLEVGFEQVDAMSLGALAAMIVEPLLSAGGVIVPPPGYLARLQELCRERGMLLVFDEAQTALGRLGSRWGYDIDGVVPDIVTLSKTIGAGIPLGATIATEAVEALCFERGYQNVTSHAADPLPAAVGLAVLDTIDREGLIDRANDLGNHLNARLLELQERHEAIGDVRGRGLMRGVEFVTDRDSRTAAPAIGGAVANRCLECGLSITVGRDPSQASCFRLAPPLTITEAEIDQAMEILDDSLSYVEAQTARLSVSK